MNTPEAFAQKRGTGIQSAERQAKAAKTRAVTADKMSRLSPEQKHGLKLLASAIDTLELMHARTLNGKSIPPEVFQACGTLQSSSATALYD